MKRVPIVLLLLLVCGLVLSACGGAAGDTNTQLGAIEESGTIRVSTDPNYEPQSFLDANGDFVGFDVEVEFVTPDWDVITAGNWGGQWDMSVGSMTVTTDRQEVLDFADPAYYFTPAQFAAADNSGIDQLADIEGQPVCVGVSTTYETWLNGDMAGLGLPEASIYSQPPTGISIVPLTTDAE